MDVSSYSTSRGLGVVNIHPNEGGSDEDGSDKDLHQLNISGGNFKDLLYIHPNVTGDGRRIPIHSTN